MEQREGLTDEHSSPYCSGDEEDFDHDADVGDSIARCGYNKE
jgi:hypothetical protein